MAKQTQYFRFIGSALLILGLSACGGNSGTPPPANNLVSLPSTTDEDKTPPTTPAGLNASSVSRNSVTLIWSASTDDTGIAGYRIFRDGTFLSTSTTLGYIDQGLIANRQYQYTVTAYDAAGNESSQSPVFIQTTSPPASSNYIDLTLSTANVVANAPIRTGVPFPYGELSSTNNLRLENRAGTMAFPAQFSALATWPDGSIKSVLVQFVTDTTAGSKEYRLAYGSSVTPASFAKTILVTQSSGITIDTGLIKFEVSQNGLISSLWQDSNNDGQYSSTEQVISNSELFLVNALDGLEYTASRATDSQLTLEENGPLRAVIKATGSMSNASGDKLIKYLVRYYAHLGSDKLDVEYSLIDDRLESNVRDTDYGRYELALSLSSYGMRMQYLNSAPTQFRFGGDNNRVHSGTVSGEHYLLQKGTFTYNDGSDEGHTFNYSGIATGNRAPGWLALDTGERHMSVMVKDFWQQFPNELSIDGQSLTIKLHPERAIDNTADTSPVVQGEGGTKIYRRPNTFYFEREGGAKTYQMRFAFSDTTPTDTHLIENNNLFQTHNLLLTATPAWYTASGVFGELNVGTSTSGETGFDALMMRDIYEPSMVDEKPATNYGWRDYGDRLRAGWSNVVNGVRIPGWYNDSHVGATNFFKMYLRTGDQRWFTLASISTRHFMDIDVSHGQRQGYWSGFGAPTQPAGEIHAIKHDMVDHTARNVHRGHAHASGLVDYYLLTGDKRSYEVMMEIGNWWKFVTPYMFPLPFNFDAPNNQGGYREATRDYGWPLFVMNEYVRLTGDENYHRETATHLVNYLIQWWQTPRERIGFDAETNTMSNTPLGKFNDASQGTGFWTMTRAGNYGAYNKANGTSPWMAGSLIGNIIEYYERDKELAIAGKASGVDYAILKQMLFQTINYVVKNGYDETNDYFVYAETIRQYGGGRTHILYSLAYLDRLYKAELAAGRIANPQWYDKQAMWGTIAKQSYNDYMTKAARNYTQSYGWYGYEIVHPLDFFKIMSEAP